MTQRQRLTACALVALSCLLLVAQPHHANPVHEHTDRPVPSVAPAAPASASTTTRLHLKLGPTGQPDIPGLYDQHDKFIHPIQGKAEFQARVLGLSSAFTREREDATDTTQQYCPTKTDNLLLEAGSSQTLSLVQFYMATCPDCQGFSPYFKRLALDIGPHWHKLVRIYVVNCNDHQNIHLCQEENPRLIVPMVRWYALPIIQADAYRLKQNNRLSIMSMGHHHHHEVKTNSSIATCRSFEYPRSLLNVAHRQFVEKQRRDLVSLRQATLRFTQHMLDLLSGHNETKYEPPKVSRDLFHALTIHWRHLPQIGHAAHKHFSQLKPANQFARELQWRVQECLRAANGEIVHRIGNSSSSSSQQHNHDHHHQGKRAANNENYNYERHLSSDEYHHDHTSGQHREHHFSMTHSEHHDKFEIDNNNNNNITGDRNHNYDMKQIDQIEPNVTTLKHFVIFEARDSLVGQTVIADWSSYVCNPNATRLVSTVGDLPANLNEKILMIVHRTSDMSLLKTIFNQTKLVNDQETHVLISFDLNPISIRNLSDTQEVDTLRGRVINFKMITGSGNEIQTIPTKRARRMAVVQPKRIEQRASLERYYRVGGHHLRRRHTLTSTNSTTTKEDEKLKSQAEREHANWTPESVFPRVETTRYMMNKFIAQEMRFGMAAAGAGAATNEYNSHEVAFNWLPGAVLAGKHPGELASSRNTLQLAVDPKTDDLTLMYLTDYYKGLDELVHTDLTTKGDLDGYQLLASCCFLRDLTRHFPFQGDAQVAGKSRARYYVQLVQQAWLGELKRYLYLLHANGTGTGTGTGMGPHDEEKITRALDKLLSRRDECPKLDELSKQMIQLKKELAKDSKRRKRRQVSKASGEDLEYQIGTEMEQVRVPIRKLETDRTEIRKQHDVGLPPEKKFKWQYCAGSGAYLRGHTCSLWILFHTLTINEYLENNMHNNSTQELLTQSVEYKFQIDFAQKPKRACDPKNPDEAYLASRSSEHHVNETQHVLANIVNFVRYYLPCTNCAAHFSCMVNHSPGLSFDDNDTRAAPASHLLWLWEGHNRVNERTRGTHSEDPRRPKHVFPVYDACPMCYIEKPRSENATLGERKFNRNELVKFLVARYRKSAILNNKINIELLYKDT